MKNSISILGQAGLLILALGIPGGVATAQVGFDPAVNYAAGNEPDTVALADFDGNKTIDIAVTSDNPDKVSVFFNLGSGTYGAPSHTFLPGGSSPQFVVAGDFDGDLDQDLAVSLKDSNSIQIVLNNGSGVFSLGGSFGVGTEPRAMAAGNLDGDTDLDLVVSNRASNTLSVLLNNGSASFAPAASYGAGQDPRGVTLGRFDANASLDIAVSAHDDRQINLFTNNGAGAFVSAGSLSVGAQLRPEGVTSADVDDDGDFDIAAATSGNGQNFATLFLNNGTGVFTGPTNFAVGGIDPSDIVAADFDEDGKLDLATVNTDSNNVSVLPGNGSGGFGASSEFAVGTEPDHLAAADLDGNGVDDIVTANKLSHNVSVLLNVNAGWIDLGSGLAGVSGVPMLSGQGSLVPGSQYSLNLTGMRGNAPAFFVVGASRIDFPFRGGVVVPALDKVVAFTTPASGSFSASPVWPNGVPNGIAIYFQVWIVDPAGVQGFAASNALQRNTN